MTEAHYFAIYSNDQAGILNRITAVFSRVNLNIESLSVCESVESGVFKHSVQVDCDHGMARRLQKQLERQVEVLKAEFRTAKAVIQQEVALYKIASKSMLEQTLVEQIMRRNHAQILSMNSEFAVIQKTGTREENQTLFAELSVVGVLDFARSGPVSIGHGSSTKSVSNDTSIYKQKATCETHEFTGASTHQSNN